MFPSFHNILIKLSQKAFYISGWLYHLPHQMGWFLTRCRLPLLRTFFKQTSQTASVIHCIFYFITIYTFLCLSFKIIYFHLQWRAHDKIVLGYCWEDKIVESHAWKMRWSRSKIHIIQNMLNWYCRIKIVIHSIPIFF